MSYEAEKPPADVKMTFNPHDEAANKAAIETINSLMLSGLWYIETINADRIELIAVEMRAFSVKSSSDTPPIDLTGFTYAQLEQNYFRQMMAKHNGVKKHAADAAGMNPPMFGKRLNKLDSWPKVGGKLTREHD